MVIAAGSYPAGRWFESDRRYQNRPHGQAVKTSPFHGGNPSSSLGGVTNQTTAIRRLFCFSPLPRLHLGVGDAESPLCGKISHPRTSPDPPRDRNGSIAQLVRALALQARGHWFESSCFHQKTKDTCFAVPFVFWWKHRGSANSRATSHYMRDVSLSFLFRKGEKPSVRAGSAACRRLPKRNSHHLQDAFAAIRPTEQEYDPRSKTHSPSRALRRCGERPVVSTSQNLKRTTVK